MMVNSVNNQTQIILAFNGDTGVPCVFGVLTCEDMDQVLRDFIMYMYTSY